MGNLCGGAAAAADADGERKSSTLSAGNSTRAHLVTTHEGRWDSKYDKEKTLGEGITGSVHLVKSKRTGEMFAKKSINLANQDPRQLEELRNELEKLRVLDHPHIIHLYEIFEHDNQIHLIMELCEGGELYNLMRPNKHSFTEDEVADICYGVLSALAYCHERKIIHRDMKPQNIVLAEKGNLRDVKLIDFGMSKESGARTFWGSRAKMTACGTPLYVAPEVISSSRYDEKIDVWAVGVLAYHLACGKHPFRGPTQQHTLENIDAHRRIAFPGRRWRDKSTLIKSFIDRILRPKIDDRMSAAEALAHPFLAGVTDARRQAQAGDQKEASLDSSHLVENMRAFSSYPDLKRASIMAIAHRLQSQQIRELRRAFLAFDVKRNGTIDRSEFDNLVDSIGEQHGGISREELQQIFDAVDQDNTGVIAYREFLAATLDTRIFLTEGRIRDAFEALDTDNSGSITTENLRTILGDEFTDQQIDTMMSSADIKKNGCIDFEEFLVLMKTEGGRESISVSMDGGLGGGRERETKVEGAAEAGEEAAPGDVEVKA